MIKEEKLKRPIIELKQFSRANKRGDVKAESSFRQALIARNIHYQRQKVIDKFIVDFYGPKRNLIVEIDEKHHENQKEYDLQRQQALKYFGYKVIRFKDTDVFGDVESCIAKILMEPESKEKYRGCKRKLATINRR